MLSAPASSPDRSTFGSFSGVTSRWGEIVAIGVVGGAIEEAHPVAINALVAIDRAVHNPDTFTNDLPLRGLAVLVGLKMPDRRLLDLDAEPLTRLIGLVHLFEAGGPFPLAPDIDTVKIAAEARERGQRQPRRADISGEGEVHRPNPR